MAKKQVAPPVKLTGVPSGFSTVILILVESPDANEKAKAVGAITVERLSFRINP